MEITKGLLDFTLVVIVTAVAVAPRAIKAYRAWREVKRASRIKA
jgi:hypothetical protein